MTGWACQLVSSLIPLLPPWPYFNFTILSLFLLLFIHHQLQPPHPTFLLHSLSPSFHSFTPSFLHLCPSPSAPLTYHADFNLRQLIRIRNVVSNSELWPLQLCFGLFARSEWWRLWQCSGPWICYNCWFCHALILNRAITAVHSVIVICCHGSSELILHLKEDSSTIKNVLFTLQFMWCYV